MKLIWKKGLALLLSVAMLLPSAVISVGAEDDVVSDAAITGQFTYPRMSALLSGGEPRTGTDVYYYRDSWFTLDPTGEDDEAWADGLSDLVVLSMQMSLTIGGEGENWAQYSAALLQKLGFEDIETNYNAANPPAELALFAHKKIGSRDLVFVLPRGNDYGKNWVNNFDVGSGSGDHAGFRKAAYDIESDLTDYLSHYMPAAAADCKYWITGYSRGAAIANLIGKDIADQRSTSGGGWDTEKQKDLFVFTFACPNVSELQSSTADDYPCIYNFFSVNDLVVQLPPEDMTGNPSKFLPYGPTYPLEMLWVNDPDAPVTPAEAEKAMLTFLRALDPSFYNDVMQGPSGNGLASSFQNAEIASSKAIGDVFPNLPQWISGYAPSDFVGVVLGTLGGSVIADAAEKGLTTEADSTISSMVNLIYNQIIGSLATQTVSQAVGLQTASEAERGYTLYGLLELKDKDTQSEFLNERVNDVWTGVLNGWRVSTLKSESGAPMADLPLRAIYNEKYQSAIMAANALVFDHGKALSDAFSTLYDAKKPENTENIKELITAVLLTYNYCVADQKDTAGTYLTRDLDQLDEYADAENHYQNIDADKYVDLWRHIYAQYSLSGTNDVGVQLKNNGENILEFHNALLSKRSGSGAFALLRTLTAAANNYLLTGSDSDLDTFLDSWASLAAMEGLSALHSIEVSGTTITPSYADYLLIQNHVDELAREICKKVLASYVDPGWDYYLGDPDSSDPYLTYYYDRAARSLGVVAKNYLQSVFGKLFTEAGISYTEDGDGKTVYDNIYLLADFLSYTLVGLDQPGALIESSNGSDEVWMDTLNVAATLYHNYKRLIYAHFPGVYLSYVKAQLGSVYVQPSLAEGAYTGAQTVTLTPLGDDGTGTVQYRINNGSWTNGNLANTTTSITLPAGTTSLSTRIYDAEDSTEAAVSERTFAYTVNSSGGGSSGGGDWSGGGSSGGGSVRPTPTTKPADTATTTVTNPDGSTSTITTSTASDGTITISATTSTGSAGTTVMSASGNTVSATTTISENALQAAAAAGKPVTAPVAIVPVPSSALGAAPVVHVTMPTSVKGYTSVADMPKVEIQVPSVTPGTVVYRRNADGSTTLIKECSTGDDSVIVPVDGSCDLIVAYNTRTFTDVQNHWAQDRIEFVTAREIFNGSGTKFDPDGTMTRAMVAQIVYNYDRFSTRGIRSDFADVPADEWFANSIGWASEQGVVGGYGTKFLPTDSITRQDLIAILYRYARSADYNVNAYENLDVYPDAASVSEYARPAMQWALSTGIIGGTDRGLEPLNLATRAEVAAIMARFVIKFA